MPATGHDWGHMTESTARADLVSRRPDDVARVLDTVFALDDSVEMALLRRDGVYEAIGRASCRERV